MVNYICVKTVPESTKLRLIKGQIKISRGSMPPDPCSLPHAAHGYIFAPPIIHTISFCPPFDKKLKETLTLPSLIPILHSHGEYFLEYITWHIVALIQKSWLEAFSLT